MAGGRATGSKGVLVWGVEIVTFVLTAFGGFLTNIAPPSQTGTQFAVGIVSFLSLTILLIVTALGRQAPGPRYRSRWIGAGFACLLACLPAALLYWQAWQRDTYAFPCSGPSTRHIGAGKGNLTGLAKEWIASHPREASPCELEMNLPADSIWESEALTAAGLRLLLLYTWLVAALATAVFSLIEANAPAANTTRGARRSSRR